MHGFRIRTMRMGQGGPVRQAQFGNESRLTASTHCLQEPDVCRSPIMVREGPAEPPPPNLADTPEGRRARPYGMQFTAAVAVIAIVIFAYFVMK